ncbi:MAG: CvpA family protein [Alphaproteobacteria bacterium]|nr:CvpA family protein [Alphaproteobacteria bacterium]
MEKLFDTSVITQFDFFVLAVIGVSIIFAFLNGFVKSLFSFVGMVIAVVLAMKLSGLFSALFIKYVMSNSLAVVVSAIMLLIVFLFVLSSINGILLTFISPLCGGFIDRSFGLIFGFIRGCVIVSFVFYIMVLLIPALDVKDKSDVFGDNLRLPKWARNSETLILLSRGADFISSIVPSHFNDSLQRSVMESKDSKGDFSISPDRIDNIRSLNKIFSVLPEDVMNSIPQKDLITLQDHMAPARKKVKILENIAKRYQRHVNSKTYYGKDVDKINKEYHEIISSIEEEINKYNSIIED